MKAKYAAVLVDAAIDKLLDYAVPDSMQETIERGMRVEVPIRGKLQRGYVIELKESTDYPSVQPIRRFLTDEALLSEELFELALWVSRYYCSTLRQTLQVMLPSSVRKEMEHKEQLFVMRAKTRELLREHCEKLREKHPAQAKVLDVLLQVKKGILLSELLEKTEGSRSPVDTLAKQGWLLIDIVRVDRSPLVEEEYFRTSPKKLNEEQALALEKIEKSLTSTQFQTHLLYGITGSGKTEVYLQAIDRALKLNKGIIMLVPEIALTAQTIERFRSRFEGKIAILHHRLSHGERFDEWHRMKRGEAKIVIGARSAIFSPIQNLGLIIIDEEHENSYKQSDESPCYQARDVAVMRGKMVQATVILGSATPSLESYYNAQRGKYTLSVLKNRAESSRLPSIKIVDMRHEYEKAGGYTNFSDPLLQAIKERQERGEQTILFLNRRGYHSMMVCQPCQKPIKCSHCDLSLTFHLGEKVLSCHLCGFQTAPPSSCPNCKSPDPLKFKGVGTEQIERSIHAVLPDIRTLRIDADTTRHKGSLQKLLREFGSGKVDLLIGTQMIAKGLHFPEVTLVGVLNSDASLNIPDFRASETVFQLITQVAGRAGRGNSPGEVVIQTAIPDNATIQLASKQDFELFYQEEIEERKLFEYPPFTGMAKILFSGKNLEETRRHGELWRQQLLQLLPSSFTIHPIIPAGYPKIKDLYRLHFLIRGTPLTHLGQVIPQIRERMNKSRSVRVLVDVNPSSTF